MLQIEGLHAHYGAAHILHGVTMMIEAGTAVGLLGRNGMGKTTLIRSLMGYLRPSAGRIQWHEREVTGTPPERMARLGIGYVPEGRGVFPNLSVRENLVMAARAGIDGKRDWTFERVIQTFPRLGARLSHGGQQLSGGEQQMLAIGRALMNHPRLLILDEPVEGLAPVIVEEIVAQLKTIKAAGVAILLVEQNLEVCVQLADRHYIVEQGVIVHEAGNADFMADHEVKDRYLGVGLA